MTAVMEDVDISSWFGADVPCQKVKPPCPKRAEWRATTTCCRTTHVLCTEHKENKEKLHEAHRSCNHLICGHCMAQPMPMPTFDRL